MSAPPAPYVASVEELHEIVDLVRQSGQCVFDLETRGNIQRHPEVMSHVEDEWQAKLVTLKSSHPRTLKRSRDAIEEAWTKQVALDPLRNEVFWIGIAIQGRSWAIPMGHRNGEIITPEERGDGKDTPPPGYRVVLASGKESMAKARYVIPATFSPPPPQLSQEEVFTVLESVFLDPTIIKINQNIKFDVKSLVKYYGQLPEGVLIDLQVEMHILDENMRSYKLTSIIEQVLGFNPYEVEGKLGESIDREPFSKACRYVHSDVRWPWLVYRRLLRQLGRQPELLSVFYRELPVIRVLAKMEMNGIMIDQYEIKRLNYALARQINKKVAEMGPYVPVGYNPDSVAHKEHLLFGSKADGGLGLKATKKTPGKKNSVDEEVLLGLKGKHPLVDLMLEYSELKKMKSTYVDNVPPMLHSGRIHPQFHLHRTTTGRISSSQPNAQNIPTDSRVRSLFIAEPGRSLVVGDFAQIEMRVMAMFSQDPALLRIFQDEIDPHFGTAQVILGRDPVDSKERNVYGKIPNFLLAYGGQAKRLVVSTKGLIDMKEAQRIVEAYDKGYIGWTKWKERTLRDARIRGYVTTMGGRRRRIAEGLIAQDRMARYGAERQAINAVIQGTAAEICKDAMVEVDGALPDHCRLLLQVHDELVISVPTDEVTTWLPVIEKSMGNGRIIEGVPLVVEAHHASSWSGAKS